MQIYVDADGCPVKPEIFRVAGRYSIQVHVAANSWMETPASPLIAMVIVNAGLNAADDWIVEHATSVDIVVTTDIPLAARCVAKGCRVLHPTGKPFTEDDIGSALAMRDLLAQLRESGATTRGPAPFRDRDRSQFLQALDTAVQKGLRAK